jgi:3-keto-5-aminohexanoate cleavage enzyme
MYLIKEMADICEFTPVNMSLMGMAQGKQLIQAETAYSQENGIKPEIACYADGDIDLARNFLVETGILEMPAWWDVIPYYFVGGTPMFNEMAMAETLINHVRQIRHMAPNSQIMVAGSGRGSSHLVALAMMLGLHVKVGMEDVYFKYPHKDDVMDDNAKNVEDTVTMAKMLGRRPATANEYRAFAGMPQR